MNERRKGTGVPDKGLLLVILASISYILLLAGGNPEIFLIDDNRTQWYPVMERAYEDFWTTGRIYCYDFYQMKGMSVAGQGYYGVMNPFILFSYAVTGLLPGGVDIITFYIGLMVVLGNLFFYLTCRRLDCKQVSAFLLTMTYGTMGCFWAYFYWYYVFNNYFLVPLLVYVFLRFTQVGRLAYCACGIVLAMDLWMGNVQYTFYHYVLFGILCLVMILLKNRRYIKILCINVMVGLAFSWPMLLLLMQASGSFQRHEDFMECQIWYPSLLIHSVIPQGILRRHGNGFSFLDTFLMGRDDNLVCYMGVVGVLLLAALVHTLVRFLKKIGKTMSLREFGEKLRAGYEGAACWTHEEKTVAGCVSALFFFLSLMSGGIAAYFLSVMPVISNFRYLFKAIYPATPLAVLLLAYLVGKAEHGGDGGSLGNSVPGGERDAVSFGKLAGRQLRISVAVLTVVFLCVGLVNAYDAVVFERQQFGRQIEGSFEEEKEIALSAMAAASMDGKNYRTAAFLQFPEVNDECFALPRNLTRNFPTAVGIFSLAGYEIATPESRLEMFDAVYSDTDFYTKYANADTQENLAGNLGKKPETVQRQLIENGVRYLLLDKSVLANNKMAQRKNNFLFERWDQREDVIAALRTLPDIRVERVCAFNDHYDLVELAGVDSLCMDSAGQRIPLTDENMQTLSFTAQAAQDYMLSFAWDRHLEASVTEADGTVRALPVEKTANGNIRLSTAKSAGGQVTLTWHDPLCTVGFVWEGLAALAFLEILLCFCTSNKETIEIM